jgi:hypothetical protein
MANQTENRKWAGTGTNQKHSPQQFDRPVAAGVELFAGELVGELASDPANRPITKMASSGVNFRGINQRHVDNTTGGVGDRRARVQAETAMMDQDGTLGVSNLFGPVYFVDTHTVTANTGTPCVGRLVDFDQTTGKPIIHADPQVARDLQRNG